MTKQIKHITNILLVILLVVSIFTINVPILALYNCKMVSNECTCYDANKNNSCCENSSQKELSLKSPKLCGCYLDQANNQADLFDHSITLQNKLISVEKSLHTNNFSAINNSLSKTILTNHSPPGINTLPVYISIHSLLI